MTDAGSLAGWLAGLETGKGCFSPLILSLLIKLDVCDRLASLGSFGEAPRGIRIMLIMRVSCWVVGGFWGCETDVSLWGSSFDPAGNGMSVATTSSAAYVYFTAGRLEQDQDTDALPHT